MGRSRARVLAAVCSIAAVLAGVGAAVRSAWLLAAAGSLLAAVAAGLLAAVSHSPAAPAPMKRPALRTPPTPDPDVVVTALLDTAVSVCPAVAAHLWLEDPATGSLRLVAAAGPLAPGPSPVPLDDPILGRASTAHEAVLDAVACVSDGHARTTSWRYALPVGSEDAPGVAAIDLNSEERPDAGLLVAATAPLRASLAGALALHVSRGETRTARALLDASRELTRTMRPEEIARRCLDHAMELSCAATGSVMLLDEGTGTMRIVESRGLPAEIVATTEVAPGEGVAGWVLSSRSPMLVEDLPGRPASRRHGVRSAASVPIADEDGVLGVLNVGSRRFPARFTDAHLQALESLGRHTAAALRTAMAVSSTRDLSFATLTALALALETKDPYSRGSTGRVVDIATALGEWMDLPASDLSALHVAALLHDIGMGMAGAPLGASERPLSTVERGLVKAHPAVAADVLAEVPALEAVGPIVYHHHEWYDGHGYVGGVAGESIPLASRILAVADAYVAMTSDRPYRRAMTPAQAVEELVGKSGSQFDPLVVDRFRELLRRRPDLAAAEA